MKDTVRKPLGRKCTTREVLQRLMPVHEKSGHTLVVVTFDGLSMGLGCSCGAAEALTASVVEALCGVEVPTLLKRMETLNRYVHLSKGER